MSTTIPASFIKQWSDDVHHFYQQDGSKLRGCVREVTGVRAATYDFHRLDEQAAANSKARGAEITPLDPTHDTITATLADYYAGDYIDKLDQLKTNPDMRREYVKTFAMLLGRTTDDIIIAELANATKTTVAAGGLTYDKILAAVEKLNEEDVDPDNRCLTVGAQQLSDALAIEQLTSGDYMSVKNVMNGEVNSALGFKWVMSTRLPLAVAERTCFAFNKRAVGLAVGQDITTEVNYIPQRVAHLVNTFMSMGAALIEDDGVILVPCTEV